jgi:N utilization substance protein B
VLRLAIFELLFDNRAAPLRVAINEAVEIAKGYGAESSGRFVNGVLGAVALATQGADQE